MDEEAIGRLTVIAEEPGPATDRLRRLIIEQLQIITVEYPELADIDISVVRHNLTGALNFVPFWFKPEGGLPDREAFERVADSVLLMFGLGSAPTSG